MIEDIKWRAARKFFLGLASLIGIEVPPTGAVAGLIQKNGKILVVNLSYRNGYSLPGGGLKASDKSFENGLIREIKEETNLDIKDLKYNESIVVKMKHYAIVTAFYELEIKNISDLKGSREGNPLWVSPSEAYEKMVYPDCKKFIKKYFKL